jgi:hypothetical protein
MTHQSTPAEEPPDPVSPASASEPQPIDLQAIAAFDQWLDLYNDTPSGADTPLAMEGESRAIARRSAMAALIASDPELALRKAIPFSSRQRLPASIVEHLEERVSGVATFEVIAHLNDEGARSGPGIERFVTLNGRTYTAHVYGRRWTQGTMENIPLHGIAVGDAMAVHESPVRVLEAGEAADPSLPAPSGGGACPVSNDAADPGIAIQVGADVYSLCQESHVAQVESELIANEAGDGARQLASTDGIPARAQGLKRVLFMRITFPGDREESLSEEQAHSLMTQANAFLIENSYGQLSLEATITPVLALPMPKQWYTSKSESAKMGAFLRDARAAAKAAGFAPSDYDLDLVQHRACSSRAYVSSKGATLQSGNPWTACHELGHNLGMWHANGWETADGSTLGAGKAREYANPFDTMGSSTHDMHHYNAYYKSRVLRWIPETAVQTVTEDGVYRLHPLDVPVLAGARTYALRIAKDAQRDYWIETRQALASRPGLRGSIVLNWNPWVRESDGTVLLDMTPGDGNRQNAPLVQGDSFYDSTLGLKIIPWSMDESGAVEVLVRHVHYLAVEPESTALTSPAFAGKDPLASQGGYVTSGALGGGAAAFKLMITEPGEYFIWCRIRSGATGALVIPIAIDGASAEAGVLPPHRSPGQWHWGRIAISSPGNGSASEPNSFRLGAGEHRVQMAVPVDVWIDCVVFTDDPTSNLPPVVTAIPDQKTIIGMPPTSIPLGIIDADLSGYASQITVSSSNPELVPQANVVLTGNLNRSLTITPAAGQLGTTQITLGIIQPDGDSESLSFSFAVIGQIQAMVDAAAPGETVHIPAGTYIERLLIDKDLVLVGAGPRETVLDGNGTHTPITVSAGAHVVIQDLTARNGRTGLRNEGVTTLVQCAIHDQESWEPGAAIWNGPGGDLHVERCTISGNRSHSIMGAGIYNAGDLVIWNSTISGNRAANPKVASHAGGGIYNAGRLSAFNSTIAENAAGRGGGIANAQTAVAMIRSTIIGGNISHQGEGADAFGSLTSHGWNLIESRDGYLLSGETATDLIGSSPGLGPLSDNGGHTLTHALATDSPAIDNGFAGGLRQDQRGWPRHWRRPPPPGSSDADGADIGAFELPPEFQRELRAVLLPGSRPGTAIVRIVLESAGNEHAIEFGLAYAKAGLTHPRMVDGHARQAGESPAAGNGRSITAEPDGTGCLRVSIVLSEGTVFPAGIHELVDIELDLAPGGAPAEIVFDDLRRSPIITDRDGNLLFTVYRGSGSTDPDGARLHSRTTPEGDMIVYLSDDLGSNWLIEATTDFVSWEPVSLLRNITSSVGFSDTSARGVSHRFYRATRHDTN